MTIYRPYQTEPHGMPLQFRDSTGEWHLFGAQWFDLNSEHVSLTRNLQRGMHIDLRGNTCGWQSLNYGWQGA